tara:strand:- start:4412 stop:5443 length:1032 start_codon:yes stop_codon:yes gene_type:complete
MKQISSFGIKEITKELQVLINSKIDKVFMDNNNEMYLQLHTPNQGKTFLRIETGTTLHLTEFKPAFKQANSFCTSLRKLINNARIRSIKQIDFERIIKIELEKQTTSYLILEFFSKGNIILTDNKNIIINCIFKQKFSTRSILPKQEYKHPKLKYNILEITKEDLKKMLETTEKESLVKALAIELALGGKYAEKLCEISRINKDLKPIQVKKIDKLYSSIKELKLIIPPEFKTLNDYLNIQYQQELSETKTDTEQSYEQEITKVRKMRDIQEKAIKNYKKGIIDNDKKAELIYQNYQLVDNIIKELKQIEKKHTWQEIKKKLKNHKVIKEVDVKNKEVVIELK